MLSHAPRQATVSLTLSVRHTGKFRTHGSVAKFGTCRRGDKAENKPMAIHRKKDACLDVSLTEAAAAVRTVLARHPPYLDTVELQGGTIFRTNVKPSRWLLDTEMVIELQPTSTGVRVIARTSSQWYIIGDVFGFYNRYLRKFFFDVKAELRRGGISSWK